MSFVFTGKMTSLAREAAEKIVKDLGGKALGSVSAALTYLVVGDGKKAGAQSTKEKTAAKLIAAGAPLLVISESDFLAMVERASAKPA